MPDNFHFDMTGVTLASALDIAFSDGPNRMAVGWAVLPTNPDNRGPGSAWDANQASERLVLFWSECDSATKLPTPMNADGVRGFVEGWLKTSDYGTEPNHDGHNTKGWRVYNEAWGHVSGERSAFVAIEPVWLLHGK